MYWLLSTENHIIYVHLVLKTVNLHKKCYIYFFEAYNKFKIHQYPNALALRKGKVYDMSKFDRTNMKVNNPAGDLLVELESANLTRDKVDSLNSSGVVCTISAECGGIFTIVCC